MKIILPALTLAEGGSLADTLTKEIISYSML